MVSIAELNKTLTGIVTDKDGKAVSGAKVMILSAGYNYADTISTDVDGCFNFPIIKLPKGAVAVIKID
ncbi:MAG: carboxypeptidase-like regulatory domain-containing protein [Muribaculaceae bacterium]|nr:carboxypeptidase-like regulatory domain-containing protein [Muribaculaceae bacterium]